MILESNDDREWILLSDSEDEEEPDYYETRVR